MQRFIFNIRRNKADMVSTRTHTYQANVKEKAYQISLSTSYVKGYYVINKNDPNRENYIQALTNYNKKMLVRTISFDEKVIYQVTRKIHFSYRNTFFPSSSSIPSIPSSPGNPSNVVSTSDRFPT